jgi:amino acid adenylation domain-containing protein
LKLEKSTSESSADRLLLTHPSQIPLPDWNNTYREYPQDLLVPHLVSKRAQETPDALALQSETQTLSYRQLECRSNQLAHYLQSLGVRSEMLLGICLQRTPEIAVTALAVMKAGGAYVPIDAECPVSRLHFMLRDAQVRLLITDQQTRSTLPAGDWQILTIDSGRTDLSAYPEKPPGVSIGGQDLAYGIYTSGSTGQPKAALITQRGLLNLIYWHCRAFSITPADRASQIASFGFDAAVWEIWPYLAAGASVHFPEDATRRSVKGLRDWLLGKQITVSFAPTALAESLMELEWPERTSLRLLLTGADTLRRYPPANLPFALINNYGPTENTVVATSGQVFSEHRPDRQPTIGRPIDNVQTYILDNSLRPVPLGSVGELYLGGAGLARGYLNRPDQEAEAFVPNPFSSLPGDRLYRTGDLARYLADGQIVFVGRTDDQIKIRGFRVEPSEIATLIDQYPGVQTSVVTARTDDGGDKRLVAYLVSSDTQLTCRALQEYLRAQLPDYMVPVAFVRLASLPLNSSGKLDRAALPAPTLLNTIPDEGFQAPTTPIEERVVSILAELLGLERVGVNDNFFFLGGHSLLGTQLIARVRNIFGVELSLRTVFDSPTAAELSNEIESLLSRQQEISAD